MHTENDAAFQCLSDRQRQLLRELGGRHVRFVVIGGYAVRFYGYLRPAHDLDLVVEFTECNLRKIQEALEALGAKATEQVVGHLAIGVKQVVKWHDTELWSSNFDLNYGRLVRDAVQVRMGDTEALVISRANLIATKLKATCLPERDRRGQDCADLAYLRRLDSV